VYEQKVLDEIRALAKTADERLTELVAALLRLRRAIDKKLARLPRAGDNPR
jgi:hypothetical protein